jgi:hypothetical protein
MAIVAMVGKDRPDDNGRRDCSHPSLSTIQSEHHTASEAVEPADSATRAGLE